ncbi:hypothetical protein ACGFZJ_29535 [Streptomyces sp. NPDC048253]|uniref:hypothetical protein n=1 Tax=Streptomyces sp. NPDC048253 TaxID=3365524 RepID=UPI00371E6C56
MAIDGWSPSIEIVGGVERVSNPSTGLQVGVSVALFAIDLLPLAWLLYGFGIYCWADGFRGGGGNAPEAPKFALRAMWFLAGGAAITGGGLLTLGWPIPGTVQLFTLGGGAVLFACLAASSR